MGIVHGYQWIKAPLDSRVAGGSRKLAFNEQFPAKGVSQVGKTLTEGSLGGAKTIIRSDAILKGKFGKFGMNVVAVLGDEKTLDRAVGMFGENSANGKLIRYIKLRNGLPPINSPKTEDDIFSLETFQNVEFASALYRSLENTSFADKLAELNDGKQIIVPNPKKHHWYQIGIGSSIWKPETHINIDALGENGKAYLKKQLGDNYAEQVDKYSDFLSKYNSADSRQQSEMKLIYFTDKDNSKTFEVMTNLLSQDNNVQRLLVDYLNEGTSIGLVKLFNYINDQAYVNNPKIDQIK